MPHFTHHDKDMSFNIVKIVPIGLKSIGFKFFFRFTNFKIFKLKMEKSQSLNSNNKSCESFTKSIS